MRGFESLPWPIVPLGKACESMQPGFARTPNENREGVFQIRMPNISRTGYFTDASEKFVSASKDELERYRVVGGDVIFSNTNSPDLVGNAAVYPVDRRPCVLSNHMTRIRVKESILLPEFLASVLHDFWNQGISQRRARQWVNQAAIDVKNLSSFKIPLPPLSEQQRIVEILQEAEGIRRLRAQAEAKAAEIVPALFFVMFGDPIANERNYEQLLLREILIGTPQNGLYKPAEAYGEGTPIVRIGDFDGSSSLRLPLQRLRLTEAEQTKYGVSKGNILINRVNSIEHLGKSVLVSDLDEATVYESNMMRLVLNQNFVLPEFLWQVARHPHFLHKLRAKAKLAINQASINQKDVLTMRIIVPPVSEQLQFVGIVRDFERMKQANDRGDTFSFSLIDSLAANAFSGALTKSWREAHRTVLAREARRRDSFLTADGIELSRGRPATAQEIEDIFTLPTDGAYADLNREQRALFDFLQRQYDGTNYPRYFTAAMVADALDGRMRRDSQTVESHLAVFAARGLLIPVTREEQQPDSGRWVYGRAWRLPLSGDLSGDNEPEEDLMPDEHLRLSELSRVGRALRHSKS